MEFQLDEFVAQPTLDVFHHCTRDQLIDIADHFGVVVSKLLRKPVIKSELWSALSEKGVLSAEPGTPETSTPSKEQNLTEMLRIKELELEVRRLDLKEKELNNDLELRKMEEETKRQIKMKELEIRQSSPDALQSQSYEFDINKCMRLIPPFNEKDVKYFTLFEHVANTLKRPKNVWPLLLQSVLTGKAQDAYASLLPEASLGYDDIKAAVLRAYELVPEAYHQKFRGFKKSDSLTYVEFGHETEALFDRWCQSKNVWDFGELWDLILVKEFRNCSPDKIATYINEQKVSEVAILADEYILTYKDI